MPIQCSLGPSAERFEAEARYRRSDPVYAWKDTAHRLPTRGWDGRPNSAYAPGLLKSDGSTDEGENFLPAGETFTLPADWFGQDGDGDGEDDGGVLSCS